jgi:hypothetical protein
MAYLGEAKRHVKGHVSHQATPYLLFPRLALLQQVPNCSISKVKCRHSAQNFAYQVDQQKGSIGRGGLRGRWKGRGERQAPGFRPKSRRLIAAHWGLIALGSSGPQVSSKFLNWTLLEERRDAGIKSLALGRFAHAVTTGPERIHPDSSDMQAAAALPPLFALALTRGDRPRRTASPTRRQKRP